MKRKGLSTVIVALLLFSCQQQVEPYKPSSFTLYTIRAGNQFSDQAGQVTADYQELRFIVKFDSSAVYKTIDTANQRDINKLYGFSDNDSLHQSYSARFGWGWNHNALTLYAYIYNAGVRSFEPLSQVEIGKEHLCSIIVSSISYIFSLNGKRVIMPRKSTTPTGRGYKLFPYFGGDEVAPHDIHIWIKEL